MSRFNRKQNTVTKPFEKARILLVDDEEDITNIIKMTFDRHAIEVTVFNDPKVALANFKPNQYDLAIFDVRMPAMSGFELYKAIKPIDDKLHVCFLTSFEIEPEDLERNNIAIGEIHCFIKKPIRISDMLKRVKAILEG